MFKPIITNFSAKFGSNRWSSYSLKLHRNVYLSSNLEYDNWLYVECNPNIINFCEQPFEIKQVINSEIYTSIPDMWILYADGTEEIREVKYDRDIMDIQVQRQIRTQQEYCKARGISHQTVTDKQLRSNKYLLSNYKTIIKTLKTQPFYEKNVQELLLDILKTNSFSIEEISLKLSIPVKNLVPNIALLLFNGSILADLDNNFFGNKLEVYTHDD